jgi:hypothetical protein
VSKVTCEPQSLVLAGVVCRLGSSLGRRIGSGLDDILEAIFIGMLGMALGAGRLSHVQPKSEGGRPDAA